MKIRATRRIQASAEAIWAAWATPQGLARWYVNRADGRAEVGATMTWHWDAFGFAVPVQVEVADAPRRLVLTADPSTRSQAHQILNTGDDDLIYLAIGDFHSEEVATYPDNGKVLIRGIGRIGHLADADYMDGEPDPPRIVPLAAASPLARTAADRDKAQ